jgi:hypothetical protein
LRRFLSLAQHELPLSHALRFAGVTLPPPPRTDVARAPTTSLVAFAPARTGPEAIWGMGAGARCPTLPGDWD